MMKYLLVPLLYLLLPLVSHATPQQAWQEAMYLAQQGKNSESMALLRGAQLQYGNEHLWAQRFDVATRLLKLKKEARQHSHYQSLLIQDTNNHDTLLKPWLAQHPKPEDAGSTIPGLLSSLIPGAGHAWLGRWGDAGVAAMLVWPLLILTFWAARRDMGPVTVFFALITAWLWSGTVFSAVSLAERGDYELWHAWWQEMWQASGLPSGPW